VSTERGGPLAGLRVVELSGIGPGPFAAMLLADLGADVVRLERPGSEGPTILSSGSWNLLHRNRRAVAVDLKHPAGSELVLRLVGSADALVEGFRPGVMERLGLGPEVALAANPRLVYGRMTGFGQDGPLAQTAGHDVNYIAIAGALGAIARDGERPLFPLNLLGDFGGGGLLLAFGILAAVIQARESGRGQVVDAAMVDGVALLTTAIHGMRAGGFWDAPPGGNILDSGAPFYEVYETSDGGHVAVGALEPQFYAELLARMEIDPAEAPQDDRARWPELKWRFAAEFRSRTAAEWAERLEGADTCATIVLGLDDAPDHHHNVARETFVTVDGHVQPAPAPRFAATPAATPTPPPRAAELPDDGLADWGVSAEELRGLRASGAVE
jgi:alpha-methylacyl-CoA racemase